MAIWRELGQRLTATVPRMLATILNGTIVAGMVVLLHRYFERGIPCRALTHFVGEGYSGTVNDENSAAIEAAGYSDAWLVTIRLAVATIVFTNVSTASSTSTCPSCATGNRYCRLNESQSRVRTIVQYEQLSAAMLRAITSKCWGGLYAVNRQARCADKRSAEEIPQATTSV